MYVSCRNVLASARGDIPTVIDHLIDAKERAHAPSRPRQCAEHRRCFASSERSGRGQRRHPARLRGRPAGRPARLRLHVPDAAEQRGQPAADGRRDGQATEAPGPHDGGCRRARAQPRLDDSGRLHLLRPVRRPRHHPRGSDHVGGHLGAPTRGRRAGPAGPGRHPRQAAQRAFGDAGPGQPLQLAGAAGPGERRQDADREGQRHRRRRISRTRSRRARPTTTTCRAEAARTTRCATGRP